MSRHGYIWCLLRAHSLFTGAHCVIVSLYDREERESKLKYLYVRIWILYMKALHTWSTSIPEVSFSNIFTLQGRISTNDFERYKKIQCTAPIFRIACTVFKSSLLVFGSSLYLKLMSEMSIELSVLIR